MPTALNRPGAALFERETPAYQGAGMQTSRRFAREHSKGLLGKSFAVSDPIVVTAGKRDSA